MTCVGDLMPFLVTTVLSIAGTVLALAVLDLLGKLPRWKIEKKSELIVPETKS